MRRQWRSPRPSAPLRGGGRGPRIGICPILVLVHRVLEDSGHCPPAASAQPHTLENAAISRPPPLPGAGLGGSAICTKSRERRSRGRWNKKEQRESAIRAHNSTLLPFPLSHRLTLLQYRGRWHCGSWLLRATLLKGGAAF